jgi:RNA ligase (TIGR02306 family)
MKEMKRKLMTIRTVSNLIPIEGADFVELAQIDGWQCVVKKGAFRVGSYGMYFEIDSFLPASDKRFSFLKNKTAFEGEEGYRIKSMKIKGMLSQGLLLPLEDFNLITYLRKESLQRYIDDREDFAEMFGVKKWEKPLALNMLGKVRGIFPFFIPKTDQERIQNIKQEDLLDSYR